MILTPPEPTDPPEPAPAVITRRTKTGVDARCSRCPGLMILWADRDLHTIHLT